MEERLMGMRATGRRVSGPAADLIEVVSDEGLKHTALVFHPQYLDHPALQDVEAHVAFLREPGVEGVAPLVRCSPAEGIYLYETGPAWSVAEVVRVLADGDDQAGIRAGLELCYLAGDVLVDALDVAVEHGLYAHGSVEPRRILLTPNGRVRLIGYGLPPVDLLEHLETGRRPRDEDTLRYAPPERFDEADEDLVSDLYCLALIGLELTMGRPVYDGLADDIRQQASRGDAVRRLYQWRERLPDTVREAYGRALKPEPDARYRDGVDFVYAFHDLLGSLDAEGPSLAEVMTEFRTSIGQGRSFEGGSTGALTVEELAALAADLDAEQQPLPPPKKPRPVEEPEPVEEEEPGEQRWGRVSRAREGEAELSIPGRDPSARDRLKDRIRSREDAGTNAARERLKERLRSRTTGEGATGRPRRRSREEGPVAETSTPSGSPARLSPKAPPAATLPKPAPSGTPSPAAPPSAPAPSPASTSTPAGAGSAAAALLERLRGSRTPRPAPPAPDRVSSPSPAPTRAAKPVAPTPAPPQPAPKPAPRTSGQQVLKVRGGGKEAEVAVPAGITVAEAAARCGEALGLLRTDLQGRLLGWPVLEHDGAQVTSELLVEDLAKLGTLTVRVVEPAEAILAFEVHAPEGLVRFRAPVALTVPARFLVAHLVDWLRLGPGPWTMRIGDRTVLPHQMLADLSPGPGTTVVVSR